MERLELPETPQMEVSKAGKVFKVPEIPAYNLQKMMQIMTNAETVALEDWDFVYETLFGEGAEAAKEVFTLSDIRSILTARIKEDMASDPLGVASSMEEFPEMPQEENPPEE